MSEEIVKYSAKTYKEHLEKEHKISTLSHYLKEIVYGGNDGIVTTFAVVAGFTGASIGSAISTYSFLTVLLFGLSNLFADGLAMGLGNFLSVRADKDIYSTERAKELHEIRQEPEMEKAETSYILQQKGFTKQQAETITDIYAQNETYWVEFMMKNELEMQNPEGENAFMNGIATFFSFVLFGFIPILPYLLISNIQTAFMSSCLSTLSALILLGFVKGKVAKKNLLTSIFEVVAIGGTSAIVAFFVGTFFRS